MGIEQHYLAFYFMFPKARTSFFLFKLLMNIVLKSIHPFNFQSKHSPLNKNTNKKFAPLVFYMINIFGVFKSQSHQGKLISLCNYLFPCIVWFWLKLILLEEKHKIGRKIRLKPDKIKKILICPIP